MTNDKIKNLSEAEIEEIKAEGGYQDIEIDGKVEFEGYRECSKRWDIIKNYIDRSGSVFDLGSHYGYFSIKSARELDCIVWSAEADEKRAKIQKMALEKNKLKNVALTQTKYDLNKLVSLMHVTEGFDTILAFSVLHYFKPEEISNVLWILSQLAPKLIVEIAVPDECEVANKGWIETEADFVKRLNALYDSVEKVGEIESAKDPNVKRPIYMAKNNKLFRTCLFGYLSDKNQGRKHCLAYFKGRWFVDDNKEWIKGFNLKTLNEFNLIWPDKHELVEKAADIYLDLINNSNGNVTDINTRNVILTNSGVKVIDYKELLGSDIYGLSWENYKFNLMDFDKGAIIENLNKFL